MILTGLNPLSEVYNLKEHIMSNSIPGITQFLISTDINDLEQAKSALNKLKMRFNELLGQEFLLSQLLKNHNNNFAKPIERY